MISLAKCHFMQRSLFDNFFPKAVSQLSGGQIEEVLHNKRAAVEATLNSALWDVSFGFWGVVLRSLYSAAVAVVVFWFFSTMDSDQSREWGHRSGYGQVHKENTLMIVYTFL